MKKLKKLHLKNDQSALYFIIFKRNIVRNVSRRNNVRRIDFENTHVQLL